MTIDRDTPQIRTRPATGPGTHAGTVALWSALRAERRARDERTARLRAMLLAGGDDRTG